jgi:hypothetical protein
VNGVPDAMSVPGLLDAAAEEFDDRAFLRLGGVIRASRTAALTAKPAGPRRVRASATSYAVRAPGRLFHSRSHVKAGHP